MTEATRTTRFTNRRIAVSSLLLILLAGVVWIVVLHGLMDQQRRDRRDLMRSLTDAKGILTGIDNPFWRIGGFEIWPRDWPVRARPTHVRFDGTDFSAERARQAVESLRERRGLRWVTVNDCRAIDEFAISTRGIATLAVLVVDGGDASDALWNALGDRPSLRFIGLADSQASESAARAWQKRNPGCRIRLTSVDGTRIEFGPPANDVLCEPVPDETQLLW